MSTSRIKMPVRIAIRSEGGWVVAYYADRQTMEGAQEIGRVPVFPTEPEPAPEHERSGRA